MSVSLPAPHPALLGGTLVEPFARREDGSLSIPCTAHALYAFGALIRECESALLEMFSQGLLSGTTHTCLGQELCQMAVVRALRQDDAIFSTHRNHGHFLTRTGNVLGLVAEIMGRDIGVCGGMGGSQHIAHGTFHSNGIQGGLTAAAVGWALGRKLAKRHAIAAAFIGDGTLGEGLLYESLNLASVWRVPVLFVLENNGIAQTTPTAPLIGGGSIEARARAFGLRTWSLDDADPDLFVKAESIVDDVRAEEAPGVLVIDTARLGPHSKGDDTRDAAEIEAIRRRDPLTRLGERLAASERQAIDFANRQFVDAVRAAAIAAPPATSSSRRHAADSAPRPGRPGPRSGDAGDCNVRASLNAALRRLLSEEDSVVLLGEDLHDPYGGAFKVTAGLSTDFPHRVMSTPISEAGIVGAGVGLALAGRRPIVEIMFADFLSLAVDQLVNHAAKLDGFPGVQVPLVVRTPSGGGRGYGPTHSQSLETLFAGVPGLTVVFPSHRHEAGALLERAVLDWPHPTLFFEHKLAYARSCTPGPFRACIADARDPAAHLFPTLESGPADADVTIVTYGGMVDAVERATDGLKEEELDVHVVVPSLLNPLPRHTLRRVLGSARRVVVVEEAPVHGGLGSEIAALLLETAFTGRFLRVGAPPALIPAARSLEIDVIPNERHIVTAVSSLFSIDADGYSGAASQ